MITYITTFYSLVVFLLVIYCLIIEIKLDLVSNKGKFQKIKF
jgi:hypothetical protein